MREIGLYALTVLIWGTTWYAVTFQTGVISPEVSVSYRFAIASLLFLGFAALRRVPLAFPTVDHAWMATQGILLSLTFICIYTATTYIASGLVAIIFSLVAVLNMMGMRMFFGTALRAGPMIGAVLGIVGVLLIFGPDSRYSSSDGDSAIGLSVSFAAALFAALAGMVIVRNQRRRIPMAPLNGFSLLYGAAVAAVYALLLDESFGFDWSMSYVGSLLYLSLVGSVLVFAAYLELIGRIGAERAGYVAVAAPVVALVVSSAFEALRLDVVAIAGLFSCIAGNVLILRGSGQKTAALR